MRALIGNRVVCICPLGRDPKNVPSFGRVAESSFLGV